MVWDFLHPVGFEVLVTVCMVHRQIAFLGCVCVQVVLICLYTCQQTSDHISPHGANPFQFLGCQCLDPSLVVVVLTCKHRARKATEKV